MRTRRRRRLASSSSPRVVVFASRRRLRPSGPHGSRGGSDGCHPRHLHGHGAVSPAPALRARAVVAPVEHPRLALARPARRRRARGARVRGVRAGARGRARGRSLRGGRGLEPRVRRHPPAPRVEARGGLRGGVPRRGRAGGAFRAAPALAFARESLVRIAREAKRWRTPRFDVSVVFLADARRRDASRGARARRRFFKRDGRGGGIRTDAERYTRARGDTYSAAKAHPTTPTTVAMMIGVLLEVLIDVARIASPARVPPSRRRARNASSRDFSNATSREFGVADGADAEPEIERALATMARATRRAGGEDAARWLELLRQENALPPTTALVLVRDAAARETSRAKKPKKPSGNAFRRGVSAATSRTTALGRAGRRMIPTGRHRSTKGRSTRGRRLSPRRILPTRPTLRLLTRRRVRLSRRTTRRRAWRSRW